MGEKKELLKLPKTCWNTSRTGKHSQYSSELNVQKQGTLREVVKNTWARGGVLGFFSGNEAGQQLDSYNVSSMAYCVATPKVPGAGCS